MPNISVLVVDDDSTQVNLLYMILSKAGYWVIKAGSGQEAFEAVRADPPDMVISDVDMPGVDGFQLASMMSMDSVFRSIPVILMSGRRVTPEDQISGLTAGCDDFLSKPVNKVELIKRVENMLKLRQVTDELDRLRRYIDSMEELPRGRAK